ncbi:MAG: lysylphosphatidylglycerol synthase transmembrane domain-containing protein [Pseudomonadota bacterium]
MPDSLIKRFLKPFLVATILGILTYSVLVLYGDAKSIGDSLVKFKWHFFFCALGLALANYMLRFVKWTYYLKCLDIKIPVKESLVVFLSGFTVSITPAKLGEVLKSLLLKESRNISIARTAPIVVAERLTDLIAILILSLVGSIAYRYGWVFVIGSSAAVLLLVLLITVRRLGEAAVGAFTRLPFLKKWKNKIWESYESTYLMAKPDRLAWPVLLSVFAWMSECVAFYLIANGMGSWHLDMLPATFIYAFSTAAGALAMMPGGLGVTEGGLTGLVQVLSENRFTPAQASATTILTRLATLWFAVFIGITALMIYIRVYMKKKTKP